jgi:DNA-directed RNA polymerase subunit K/omega
MSSKDLTEYTSEEELTGDIITEEDFTTIDEDDDIIEEVIIEDDEEDVENDESIIEDKLIKEVKVVSGKTMPKLTRYEVATLIAVRASLLDKSHPTEDPIEQAKKELEQGILPLKIGRPLYNGEEEIIDVSLMQLPDLT